MSNLSNYAYYVDDRISVFNLTTSNYIGVDNLLQNRGGVCESEYLPSEGTTIAFKKGDILIGNIRPYFKKIWLAKFDGGCSTDVLCIRSNGKILPECLYAILSQDLFFDYDMAGSKGSKMPRGDKNHIMNFPIPELNNQDKIGKLIVSINEKMKINNIINSELESMAKTLYDYWFLQFEFPNEEGKPYKSSGGKMVWNDELKREIPEGWEVKELLDLVDWITNSQPPKSVFKYQPQQGYVRFIQNRDYASSEHVTYIPFKKSMNVVDRFDILMDKYGDAGVVRYGIAGVFNVALAQIKPKKDTMREYIRSLLLSNSMYTYFHNSCMASTRASLSEENLKLVYVAVPSEKIMLSFEKQISAFRKMILKNIDQNQELASLRDFLLPMLMNGQVTFKDEVKA